MEFKHTGMASHHMSAPGELWRSTQTREIYLRIRDGYGARALCQERSNDHFYSIVLSGADLGIVVKTRFSDNTYITVKEVAPIELKEVS